MGSLDIARATARRIDNINTGYDMWDRWSVNPSRDGVTLFPNKETDCSACCGIILKSAFTKLNLTGTFWTGNVRERLAESGYLAKAIPVGGKNAEQIRALLQPGDILLNTVNHVEYWDGGSLFSAVIDERGKGTGGAAGDQTGKETRFRSLYVYGAGNGWDWIVRPDYAKRDKELAKAEKKPDPREKGDTPMHTIKVDGKHYFTVGQEFVTHHGAMAQVEVTRKVGSTLDEIHSLTRAQFMDLLDGFGIPRKVVGVADVLNSETGKMEGNGTWSRGRETVALLKKLGK